MSKSEGRFDLILLVITGAIFAVLFLMAYLLFSTPSLIAIGIGAGLVIFQLVTLQGKLASKFKYGRHSPSAFLLFLLVAPTTLGIIIGYDTYSIQQSIVTAILLWGLTLTFWSTLLFVPLSLYSKYRESFLKDLSSYPRITVIVPAHNEEKVIERTIQGLLATNYPDKEIVVVNDGSKDTTAEIIDKYKRQVKILHKTNNGKASAINFGLAYATGKIIVVIDADTIIGPDSLIHLVKGFAFDKDVAAVAGNIKVRNKMNWLTWCQALEYVTGIQIARRALDVFGAINVIPGALGAFKKEILEEIGSYHKDTLVEDFDLTLKILKSKLVIAGSTKATAFTEAPETLSSFVRQRRRWYGGNLQVFVRHSDALFNPRFGLLQRLVFPFMIFSSVIMPFVGLITIGVAIVAAMSQNALFVAEIFAIFCVLQCLQATLAIRLDNEDPKLILYAVFLVIGFKQIIDFLQIRAVFERLLNRKAVWTRADRVGI
jgi:poly-beta-1,6 N-acetyl-D-glucosamine synthase